MSITTKLNNYISNSRLSKVVRRFKENEEGVTAIEFAFVGPPFFFLIFAIIEAALFFLASQYLETVTDDIARDYRTGRTTDIATQSDLREELCKEIVVLFDCNDIIVQVDLVDNFSDLPAPLDSGNSDNFDDAGNFTPEERFPIEVCPGKVLQMSTSYKWKVFTNYAAPLISDGFIEPDDLAADDNRTFPDSDRALINVTAVVRTEDFPLPPGTTC